MHKNNTWVSLSEDHMMNALKVTVYPPVFQQVISMQSLLAAKNPKWAAMEIAQMVGKQIARQVQEQIAAALSKKDVLGVDLTGKKPLPWDNPAANPMNDMIDFIQEDMKFPMHEHQKKVLAQAGWYDQGGYTPTGPSLGKAVTDKLAEAIPGFEYMKQACPEGCAAPYHKDSPLRITIIHLNDHHKWTRERIADWLETLDHDLTFKTPEEVNADAEHADT